MDARGQLGGVGCLFSLSDFWGYNSGVQAWEQLQDPLSCLSGLFYFLRGFFLSIPYVYLVLLCDSNIPKVPPDSRSSAS